MPKIDDVILLINSISSRNYGHARRCVEAMIANEHSANNRQKLERALSRWPNQTLVELPREIKSLVWSEEPKRTLDSLYLDPAVTTEIQRFLMERTKSEEIRTAGLSVRNRVLLSGPPGNGKTSLAEALAKSLGLTFLPIKLHSVLAGTMGHTSKNIGSLFDYAMFNSTLLFFDELDAIGSTRHQGGSGSDKEYNSIMNTLLMASDRLPDTSIIVGATNMPEMLDPALERRFDLKLWLGSPTDSQIEKYLADYQAIHSVEFPELFNELQGSPWSRIAEFCTNKHKSIIMGVD